MAWKSGQSYSADLRGRVLAAIDGGIPARAVARAVPGQRVLIYKALGRRATTGETEARPQRNHQTLKLETIMPRLRPRWRAGRTSSWKSCGLGSLATHEVAASLGLMHKTLARLGLTKKSRGGHKSRTGRTSPSNGPPGGPSKTP